MADTAHTPTAQDCPASRQIRVFLSSTFRDFMEERDLLVKQVFPALRRRAQERGVEVVDVDLRWGVTQEESEQGKVIGICLAEIERCRPYFIGMLGERYGWTPGKTDYPDELFEREQLGWIRNHQGNASVTELEILHGVLNDKEMAGRAFFYFRDPAWSRAQSQPGFVCDTPEEEAKLAALKDRIRASGFPVAEDLADPKTIADQIEADLWALIEQQYPDLDQADALEKEARKHASYRQSRLGVYLGQEYVDQLEALVHGGEQKILITGESGSGKSALIANWMHQHEREHPADVVYAHHLGCSNDANEIRPLLGRMLDTASKLLKEAELITEPIQVPVDWWELTAKVVETLQDLGRWCRRAGHRWIWVLDGLDRLADDDQQALPWLPLLIPEGVSVVFSALDCPARAILLERKFQSLEIGPLKRSEQEQLIETYLERYTKKLDAGGVEQILACDLARSPLFLGVLLEELRQCGRFETLKDQIEAYIRPNADGSLAVNDLYARVLARLERDYGPEPVRKALTALWASRAGLSEQELLATTELAPLQWAPIDLALDKAFGRNGNRLVFDHDYLRIAVQGRYLPSEEQQRQAHSELADGYQEREGWDERDSEELPWQLLQAERLEDLRDWLLVPRILAELQWDRGSREVINYWLIAKADGDGELDELITEAVDKEIEERKEDAADLIWFVDRIADLLDEAGLYRELLLRMRALSLELEDASKDKSEESMLFSLKWLADAHCDCGHYDQALPLYQQGLELSERLLGNDHSDTLNIMNALGLCLKKQGDNKLASYTYKRCLKAMERVLGWDHPSTLATLNNLAVVTQDMGNLDQAESLFKRCLAARERLQGSAHQDTLTPLNNLAVILHEKGDTNQAEALHKRCLDLRVGLFGFEHPDTLQSLSNLASLYSDKEDYASADSLYRRSIEAAKRLLGVEHPDTLTMILNHAQTCIEMSRLDHAEQLYFECLEIQERLYGLEHESALATIHKLGVFYNDIKSYDSAERYLIRCLEARKLLFGADDRRILDVILDLITLFANKGDYRKAKKYCRQALKHSAIQANITATIFYRLGFIYFESGDLIQAEMFYKRCLQSQEKALGQHHNDLNATRWALANLLSSQERYSESIPLRREEITHSEKQHGRCTPDILMSIYRLAEDLYWANEYKEAEDLYREALAGRIAVLGEHHHEVMATRFHLARCLSAQGSYKEALGLRRIELDWCEANEAVDVKDTLVSMHELGCELMNDGQFEDALNVLQNCLSQRQSILGASNDDTLTTVRKLIEIFSLLNRHQDAITLSQLTHQSLAHELGKDDPRLLSQLFNQGVLYSELGELDQAENLFRQCLAGREKIYGEKHPSTLITAFRLADVLSQQKRHNEAIPLRIRELVWSRKEYGNTHEDTLTSINDLASDLQAIGDFESAETLFRELLSGFQDTLEAGNFKIGYALGRLARILAKAGKQEEALGYFQKALEHRIQHEGSQNLWTNRERLGLARVLHKLGRKIEAITLLQELEASMARIIHPDDDDRQLLRDAEVLLHEIEMTPLEKD